MITSVLVNLLGAMCFLFFFWRRLKEDYPANEIFSTASLMLAGVGAGVWISQTYFPSWFFWLGLLGSALGFTIGLFRFHFRFHESLEAAGISFLPWISILFLWDSTTTSSAVSLLGFLLTLFFLGSFYILDIHYKKLAWYRSGRVGFAGLAISGLFFLMRAAVGGVYPHVLTFSGRIDALISGIVAFAFFLLIYNLSKSE